jgi:hypothetical protein
VDVTNLSQANLDRRPRLICRNPNFNNPERQQRNDRFKTCIERPEDSGEIPAGAGAALFRWGGFSRPHRGLDAEGGEQKTAGK